jgi:hypothetical protein
MRSNLFCVAGVALGGAVALGTLIGSTASAEDCYGLDAARVCATPNPAGIPQVDPTGSAINECVHVGSTCTPVTVPVPVVTPGTGLPVTPGCYIGNQTCQQYICDMTCAESAAYVPDRG